METHESISRLVYRFVEAGLDPGLAQNLVVDAIKTGVGLIFAPRHLRPREREKALLYAKVIALLAKDDLERAVDLQLALIDVRAARLAGQIH